MKTHYTFFLLGLMILTSCQQVSNSQDSQSQPSIITSDSTNHSSNDESSLAPSSEYIPPYDPAIPGLTHSSVWPSANLDAYLTYAKNINMPNFSALSGFHHGVYESLELGEFYRVVTRVNDQNELASYQNRLINDFDFKVEAVAELPGLYYAESQYDDVRIYFEYKQSGTIKEIVFDFFDGSGDDYKGLSANDGLALFDFRTNAAITSQSTTRVKWEVRPATFTVYKNDSGYNVGNDNFSQLKNPLKIYPGQSATFSVPSQYYIVGIKILAASGYADDTVLEGQFNGATATDEVDFVYVTPLNQPSDITFSLPKIQYVGAVSWLDVRLTLAKR